MINIDYKRGKINKDSFFSEKKYEFLGDALYLLLFFVMLYLFMLLLPI